MIRSAVYGTGGKLGCSAGSSCCSDCASHRLGDVSDQGNTSGGLLLSLAAIFGGLIIAVAASGKVGSRR